MTYIAEARIPGNEFHNLVGLPLFDWHPPATPSSPSPRTCRAARIADRTGLPIGVVLAHFEAAGLGEAR